MPSRISAACRSCACARFLILLNPFRTASQLGVVGEARPTDFPTHSAEITDQSWPEYQPEFLVEDEVEIALQVNGKVRDRVTVPSAATTPNWKRSPAPTTGAGIHSRTRRFARWSSFRKSLSTSSRPKKARIRMLKEFKEFAIKGNVVDLAVAVIIGAAFGKIVTSLVEDIIMPIVGKADRRPRLQQHVVPLSRQE